LTDVTIEAAGLWSASAEQVAELLGFDPHSAGLVIPYQHPRTEKVALNRVRPDYPPIIGQKPAKYLSPKGASNRLYFSPDSAESLQNPGIPIVLTEGEIKALWGYQSGLLIVGLIGVYGWRGKNARGEVGPILDLDLINFHDRIITIVFDSDVATNEKVKEARAALARELYRRGARIVYKIDLPTLDGEKVGIDDFLKDQGIEAFADLDIEEIASPYPRVKLWSGIELRETPMERPPAIVKGWGIRRAGKGLICGQGGRGKTTLQRFSVE
jgi:hypothetical protein